jgi:hypothetical protein
VSERERERGGGGGEARRIPAGRGGIRRVISDLNKLRYVLGISALPASTIRTETTRAEPVAPGWRGARRTRGERREHECNLSLL